MTISIVMPTYNGSRFLSATLDSVQAQTFSDWELIVVDDGSQDDTVTVARDYAARDPRIRVLTQPNGGVACARNRGYAESCVSSGFVIFLDHDDVWHPEALSVLSAALSAHPEAVAAHGLARITDWQGQVMGKGRTAIQNHTRRRWDNGRIMACSREEPTTTEAILFDNWICTPGLALIKRTALAAMTVPRNNVPTEQLFDPEAVPLDDWDFWLRLSLCGEIAFVDAVILDWRRHDTAGSKNITAMEHAEWRLREHMTRMPQLSPEQRGIAKERFQRLQVTQSRREARRFWAAARLSVLHGQFKRAWGQSRQGVIHYLRYVRDRQHRRQGRQQVT